MSLTIKHAGSLVAADTIHAKTGGVIKEVESVYSKQNGVLVQVYQNLIEINLGSTKNINIASWLVSRGVRDGANVIVTLPSGSIVGGTIAGVYAMDMGDIRRWKSVHMKIAGEIQGRGGIVSNRSGAHCLSTQYPFKLEILSTGAIRGGGGAGGVGGDGGAGDYLSYGSWQNSFGEPRYRWEQSNGSPAVKILWNDKQVYYNLNHGWTASGQNDTAVGSDGYTYQRQSSVRWEDKYWDIRRGKQAYGAIGVGGAGGNGQGYNQARTFGAEGTNGTNGAGDGGRGGSGVTWGAKGGAGETGEDGNLGSGKAGQAGGEGGYSIFAPGIGIQYKNSGTVQGFSHFTAQTFEE